MFITLPEFADFAETMARIYQLRTDIHNATARHESGPHKANDGAFQIYFPGLHDEESFHVSIYSFVLAPKRAHNFEGDSLDAALDEAEAALSLWIKKADEEAEGEPDDQ